MINTSLGPAIFLSNNNVFLLLCHHVSIEFSDCHLFESVTYNGRQYHTIKTIITCQFNADIKYIDIHHCAITILTQSGGVYIVGMTNVIDSIKHNLQPVYIQIPVDNPISCLKTIEYANPETYALSTNGQLYYWICPTLFNANEIIPEPIFVQYKIKSFSAEYLHLLTTDGKLRVCQTSTDLYTMYEYQKEKLRDFTDGSSVDTDQHVVESINDDLYLTYDGSLYKCVNIQIQILLMTQVKSYCTYGKESDKYIVVDHSNNLYLNANNNVINLCWPRLYNITNLSNVDIGFVIVSDNNAVYLCRLSCLRSNTVNLFRLRSDTINLSRLRSDKVNLSAKRSDTINLSNDPTSVNVIAVF